MKEVKEQVIVVGGGAAGMMAAIQAAGQGNPVMLLEKNEKLGKKLFITGKGRCNLTNACDTEELFQNVMTNPKFLYSAFYGFSNQMTVSYFEELGLPCKTERGGRVFPVSDHSSDVIRVLEQELSGKGVKVQLGTRVKRLVIRDGVCSGVVLTDGTVLPAKYVIMATGGISYPGTGACRDGFQIAEEAGHRVIPLQPSLVPLELKEDTGSLMGVSLKNVTASVFAGDKKVYTEFGEMLFTHFGVSGPIILKASAVLHKYLDRELRLSIDLKPALNEKTLDERIVRDFQNCQNKKLENSLDKLLLRALIPVVIGQSGLSGEKRIHDLTKEERHRLGRTIKDFTFTVSGLRGFEEAIITKGGIHVKEVDPATMESKLVKGLYFAGEMLDLDALTGGFNLQIAWSTGFLAGTSLQSDEK